MYNFTPRRHNNPFPEDTSPIPSGSGVFGKNNSGGRWLRPGSTVNIPDQVGKETRVIQDDLCTRIETGGGGVYFDTSQVLTKWAFAIRGKEYIEDITSAFLAGNYIDIDGWMDAVMLRSNLGQYITYADSASTLYAWDGTGNTLLSPPPSDPATPFDLLFYCDETDVHLYLNGIYRGYITPGGVTGFDLVYLMRAYSPGAFGPYSSNGQYCDARLWDLTSRTPTEINDYMAINGELFHYDATPKADGWAKRIIGLNEKTGTEAVDTGDATPINGAYYLTDRDVHTSTLHDITLFPEWIQNQHNKYGYKIDGTRVIPNTPNLTNVLGTPDFVKSVKYNAEIRGGERAVFTGVNPTILTDKFLPGQTQVNIDIEFEINDLLGNETLFSAAGFSSQKGILIITQNDRIRITIADGATNQQQTVPIVLVANTKNYMSFAWNGLIGGQVDVTINGVDFNYLSTKEWVGDSNQLIRFGTFTTSSFPLDGFMSYAKVNDIILLGLNGHPIDSVDNTVYSDVGVTYTETNEPATKTVISHLTKKWYLLAGGEEIIEPEFSLPGGATEYKAGYNHAFTFITEFDPVDIRPTQEIGHKAHLFMNRLCYTGNAFGFPEYWDGDAPFITDTDLANVYAWKDVSMDYILAHANAIAKRFIYQYLLDSRVKDIILYANQKTIGEQTILTDLGWEKTYI
jgi:hypothetical protein